MGDLLVAPYVTKLSSNTSEGTKVRHSLSFVYQFGNTNPDNLVSVPGFGTFAGDQYVLTLGNIGNIAFPTAKSMVLSCEFFNNASPDQALDSDLIVAFNPTGMTYRIAGAMSPVDIGTNVPTVVTACLPVVATSTSGISFSKANWSVDPTAIGKLIVTLFDFRLRPFITQGISNLS